MFQNGPSPEYLDAIKSKLDSMNKAAGIDPSMRNSAGGQVYGEPRFMDPMEWAGQAAMEYLRSKGKNPNLTDISGPLNS